MYSGMRCAMTQTLNSIIFQPQNKDRLTLETNLIQGALSWSTKFFLLFHTMVSMATVNLPLIRVLSSWKEFKNPKTYNTEVK